MSPTQAQHFSENWRVVDQFTSSEVTGTGFSATVFEEVSGPNVGKRYLAIRGTEPSSLLDFIADADLALFNGVAARQTVDLYNYYQRLTAQKGQLVAQLEWTGQSYVLSTSGGATGLLDTPLAGPITVTGHSLGGHLAMAFGRLFPDATGEILTYNAPGFFDAPADEFFARIDAALGRSGSSFRDTLTMNLYGSGLSIIAGFADDHGTPQQIFLEGNTHSIVSLTDSLALYDLFAKIDPALNTTDPAVGIGKITDLLKAASSAPALSLEASLDSLRTLFSDPAAPAPASTAPDNREQFYQNLHATDFQNRISAYTGLLSVVPLTDKNALTIEANAFSDIAYRYALKALNAFAILGEAGIYDQFNLGGELDVYDPVTRAGTLTADWIADRSNLLFAQLIRNTQDNPDIARIPGSSDISTEYHHYRDGKEEVFFADPQEPVGSLPLKTQVVEFADDAGRSLIGTDFVLGDRLYGGGGTDYLEGKTGQDYLEGGRGLDLYTYNSTRNLGVFGATFTGDGADTVRDVDGKGVLRLVRTEKTLGSITSVLGSVIVDASVKVSDNSWQSADGRFGYVKAGSDLVVTINGEGGGTITLKDWRDGDFGIRLWEARIAPEFAATANVVKGGDEEANTLTGTAVADLIQALGGNDSVNAGAGDDIVEGGDGADRLNGEADNDRLFGGAGRDEIDGGTGNDEAYGGADADIVQGRAGADKLAGQAGADIVAGDDGDDEVYADEAVTLTMALTQAESQTGSGLKGDWVDGGEGNDIVVGGVDNDQLMGGGGADIMIGGAGDDNLVGDLGRTLVHIDNWMVTRETIQSAGSVTYRLSYNADAQVAVSANGARDILYGGAGSDWIFGGAGDDYIDGGSGEDIAFGEAGSDVLIGGADNDILVGDNPGVVAAADEGGDYLDGGAGNDQLFGNGGADILIGGPGVDTLVGGIGKDIYVFNKGDGTETVFDTPAGANDPEASILILGEGVNRSDIKFRTGSLMVDFGGGDAIHFEGFDQLNPANAPLIGEIRFADGTSMSYEDILAQGFDIDGTEEGDDGHDAAHPQLNGTGVTDRIRGFGGNDIIAGLAGDDTLDGGAGNDVIVGGAGADTLIGGAGFDQLQGGSGNDNLQGGDDNDQLFGDADDATEATSGDDVLDGGAGDDFLFGNAGNDRIFGGADNDTLFGEAGDDQLAGEAGDDFINAGTGNDLSYGGAGADTYFYARGDGADRIFDTAGEGNVIRFARGIDGTPISFELGSLIIRVAGVAGDEIHLDGFDPGDPLGSSPIDFLEFWNGSSFNRVSLSSFLAQKGLKISGTDGADQMQGTILRDLLFGSAGDDYIDALDGNDVIDGGAGADVLLGGAGSDSLDGGPGVDVMIGGADDDTYQLDDLGDQVFEFENEGTDTIKAPFDYSLADLPDVENLVLQGSAISGLGNELNNNIRGNTAANVLSGNAGGDILRGEEGNDTLDGGDGNDALLGGRDDDRLIGGAGNDSLQGGLGNDTYVFGPGDGTDGIGDANVAVDGFFGSGTDTLELQALPSEVVITRTLFDARVELPATGDALTIPSQYSRVQQGQYVNRVEGIRFGDGPDESFDDHITPVAATVFADTLFGGNRSDMLLGLNGADTLYGMGGDDVLEGGPGSDVLSGGDGNDVYRWGRGSGHDTVDDFDQSKFVFDSPPFFYTGFNFGFDHSADELDTVQIDADLSPDDIHVSRSGSNYVLAIRHGCDTLTLASWGSDFALRPEFHKETRGLRVVFADGTVWDRARLDELVEPTLPTEGADTVQGTPGDDLVLGLGGDDSLFGFASNDTLDGGAGNDSLDGGSGSDTYLFGRGSGADTITAGDSSANSIDRILFAPDVAPADVVVRQSQTEFQALTLSITDSGDAITLRSHFGFPVEARLDVVEFADGTVWDKQALLVQSVTGTDSADTISSWGAGAVMDGRGGNDALFGSNAGETLLGGAGDDVIRAFGGIDHIDGGPGDDRIEFATGDTIAFGLGSGRDVINGGNQNTIVLGAGTTPADVRVVEGDTFLRLELPATGDSLTVNGWRNILFSFGTPSPSYTGALKEVRFADGTVWNQSALINQAVSGMVGTAGFDNLFGTVNADTLEGFAGNDTLAGFGGVDVYRFDRGYGVDLVVDSFDFLRNTGNLIRLGSGLVPSATFVVREGNDTALEFGGGDKLIVKGGIFASQFSTISSLEFADGTVWSNATIAGMARTAVAGGTSAANTLSGTNSAEYIDAREGNDTLFANGGDDVLIGGPGDDRLFGGAGSDLYFFAPGFGFDTLSDPGGAGEIDTIRFAPQFAPADIAVTRDPEGSLYLVHLGGSGRVVFAEGDIERVEFAEGIAWDAAQLQAMAALLPGTALDDLLFGTPLGERIDGLDGDDLIRGGAGDDVLDGGPGTDTLVGDEGNDTFVLARGNGEDVISQLDATELFVDTLSVQALPSEVRATRDETHLYVSITGGDARARLDGWFAATATDVNRIDQVRFADDTTWDRSQLTANLTHTEPTAGDDRIFGVDGAETISALAGNDTVLGRGGDDTLDGGPGDDVIEGGEGANVYLFDRGSGADRVIALNDGTVDTLLLGPGLAPADVRLIVLPASSDLTLTVPDGADRVTIQGGYADALAGWQTIQIAFDDGTLWSADSLASRADIMEPPVLVAPLPDHSVLQNQFFEYQVPTGTFADPDAGDSLTLSANWLLGFSASPLPAWLSFDAGSGTLRGTPTKNDVTNYSIRVTATDSTGLGASDVLVLSVVNVNDAPELVVPLADATFQAGNLSDYFYPSTTFRDIDAGDTLTFTASLADGTALPAWLEFAPQFSRFTVNPTTEDVGALQVRLTATDGSGAEASDVFQLTITPAPSTVTSDGNHSPVLLQQIPDQMIAVGGRFDFTIPEGTFVDEDVEHENGKFCGDVLAFQATLADGSLLPGWLQFDPTTLTFSGTPGAGDTGDLSVRVLAYDTNGASARETFLLKVQSDSTNRPPVAAPIEDQEALEDAAFAFVVPPGTFTDPDAADAFTLSAELAGGSPLPAWLQFDAAAGSFSGTPENGDVGQISIRLTATDIALESASSEFSLSVVNVNDAPTVASPLADQTVLVNSSFSFAVPAGAFADVDAGDVLSLSASLADGGPLPAWIAFDAATATFFGSAGDEEEGSHAIRLVATDEAGASVVDEFRLGVICTEGVTRTGTSGADALRGTHCDDMLDGGAGIDTLIGKGGNDLYFVDATLVRDPQGDEGVGNGEDPAPPGHGDNQNDGPGTGPGDPGSAGGSVAGSEQTAGGFPWRLVPDSVLEAADGGYDTIVAAASFSLPDNVEELHLGGPLALDGTGNVLDNVIVGNAAANRLAGGAGDDLLMGGAGGDTYLVGPNEGADLIDETSAGAGGQDWLEFGAGIASAAVGVARRGDDLVFALPGTGNSVTVAAWFASENARVEHVRFADGTVWSEQDIERAFERPAESSPFTLAGEDADASLAAAPTHSGVPASESDIGTPAEEQTDDPLRRRIQSLIDRWFDEAQYRQAYGLSGFYQSSADADGVRVLAAGDPAANATQWNRIARRLPLHLAQYADGGLDLHEGAFSDAFGTAFFGGGTPVVNAVGLSAVPSNSLKSFQGLQEGWARLA